MKADINRRVNYVNKLASYKAQIVQTFRHNQILIKTDYPKLDKAHMWIQAAVYQNTKLSLGQIAYKNFPIASVKSWSEEKLKQTINKAKPYSDLMAASVNTQAE